MSYIKSEKQYDAIMKRIDALIEFIDDDTPSDNEQMLELDLLVSVVVDYEEEHFPIGEPNIEKGN